MSAETCTLPAPTSAASCGITRAGSPERRTSAPPVCSRRSARQSSRKRRRGSPDGPQSRSSNTKTGSTVPPGPGRVERGQQRRVVAEPQVAPEPEHGGGHRPSVGATFAPGVPCGHPFGAFGTEARPRRTAPASGIMAAVPELPEVEALAAFLRENAVGRVLTRADLASVQAIKTFDPPLSRARRPRGHRREPARQVPRPRRLRAAPRRPPGAGRLAALAREPAARAAEAGQGSAGPARAPARTATASTSPSRAPARGWRSTSSGRRRRCPGIARLGPGALDVDRETFADAAWPAAAGSSRARSPTRR